MRKVAVAEAFWQLFDSGHILNRNGNESFEISLPDKVYTVVLYQYIAFCSVQARSSAGVESVGGGECRFRFI